MARIRMITRTITQTTAKVMTVDVSTAKVETEDFTIGGSYSDNTELLCKLQELFNTDSKKLVNVQDKQEEELLLGMEEEEFIRLAKVLPPRGKSVEKE